MAVASAAKTATPASVSTRWSQLIFGIICMVMIANLQYGWNLFVNPIDQKFHWGREAIQWAFAIFIFTETWLVPVEGWFVDRFGPRIVVTFGGVLVAIAWALNSVASSLPVLYLAAILSGVGAGAVYGTCVGNSLRWFADRRGLAAGLTAAGFGAGAAATVVPIREIIGTYGYEAAFLWFGIGQGLIILVLSQFIRAPGPGEVPAPAAGAVQQTKRQYAPSEIVRTPLFWVLYAMFVMVAAGGLMATAQLASIAADFGVDKTPVTFLWISGTTLSVALVVDNVLNGLARPFFGWVSDKIGREVTMSTVFALGALSIIGLGYLGTTPWLFIVLGGCVYFTWGEIYSLFPATCTDAYGTKYAATNSGMLYTAKGTAALLVPLANVLTTATGSWHAAFIVAAVMDLVAAVMAIAVLRRMRQGREPIPISYEAAARGLRIAGGIALVLSVCWWLAFHSPMADVTQTACLFYSTQACTAVTSASGAAEYLVFRPFLTWIGIACIVGAALIAALQPRSASRPA
jgi:OFA family oxalate/formate antiporter-like MFS transporter